MVVVLLLTAWPPHSFAIACFMRPPPASPSRVPTHPSCTASLTTADDYFTKKSSSTIATAINVGVPLVADRRCCWGAAAWLVVGVELHQLQVNMYVAGRAWGPLQGAQLSAQACPNPASLIPPHPAPPLSLL